MFRFTIILLAVTALSLSAPRKSIKPRPGGRIVGGRDATIQEVPYQISLMEDGSFNCGGAIIDVKWIVTAAHCTDGVNAADLTVRVGSDTLSEDSGQLIQVKTIHQNPKFNYNAIDYDISILELAEDITNENAKPIPLADADTKIEPGANATITGFGVVNEDDYDLPDQLQLAIVPIIDQQNCVEEYEEYANITDRMLCAGFPQGGVDSCQGDSGGPLVIDQKLCGVVSFGVGCARPGFAGVYSSVPSMRDFIKNVTGI